ncbi:hypothetical protein F5144DRAFT_596398 [Chaetomium tenue]|uniref:Uncharacterized protein n=1 Tax=Chaetomium tenue TaxID=1854479 RepID=A0ACB7NVF8_9PEZI|nr:hypothetical protein F5144DRAFT_596398 [Chaetomium globosum]
MVTPRTPTSAGTPGNSGNTVNAGNARNAGNTGNAAGGNAGTARTTAAQLPLFSAEIEVYIKVKPNVEADVKEKKSTNPSTLPPYWRDWDFDLHNDGDGRAVSAQQLRAINIVKATIDGVLGRENGWKCGIDRSLRDDWLQFGPGSEPRKWWGIEIITPLMSVSKQWQPEINAVWEELGKKFDFWTDSQCGLHIHISPGPTKENCYTLDQIVKIAKGTYFWEMPLAHLVPQGRQHNQYAQPNNTVFLSGEYMGVPGGGWAKVFSKIDSAASTRDNLLDELKGGKTGSRRYTANLSTNFAPVSDKGTIELRRLAGVASALSTIRGILLAVTLHISALRYDFDRASSRKDHPDDEELIKELAGVIKRLPETCHGTRFVHWLRWCHQVNAPGNAFHPAQINTREEAYRKGLPSPVQPTYRPRSEPCPPEACVLPIFALSPQARAAAELAAEETRTKASARGGGASKRGGGAASGRGGAAGQGSPNPSRAPPPVQTGRGGGAAATGRGGAATRGRGGAAAGGRGGASQGSSTATTRSPAANASASTGGTRTTRLPERPAAASTSRTAASSSNATNTNANASASGTGQRRRLQGEGA